MRIHNFIFGPNDIQKNCNIKYNLEQMVTKSGTKEGKPVLEWFTRIVRPSKIIDQILIPDYGWAAACSDGQGGDGSDEG